MALQLQERRPQEENNDQMMNVMNILKLDERREEKNLGFREQDKERNIFSNILKSFFIVLYEKRSMDGWINKLLSESSSSLTLA